MEVTMLQARQAMPRMNQSPPYIPTTAGLGGSPSIKVDVPICTVFMALYIIGAASHMTILQVNQRRGHKFIMSGMMFGFCMARITTMIMRIIWATRPTNIRIAIAAQVFVAAGVLLLFIINILFAQRIFRAQHPNSGWHPVFHYAFIAIYVLIVISLAMIITAVVQSFYTLNNNTRRIDRDIQLYGQTFYTIIAFLPIPIFIAGLIIPRKSRVEKFGQGRFRHQIIILLVSASLLCLGAAFRTGTTYAGGTRPSSNPAGYQSKACFYIFNFVLEVIVIYLYILVRVDRRFFVPNGSKGPGDYSRKVEDQKRSHSMGEGRLERKIASEEEVFDGMSNGDIARQAGNGKVADEENAMATNAEKNAVSIGTTKESLAIPPGTAA